MLTHVTFQMPYVDPWDMLNNFCLHVFCLKDAKKLSSGPPTSHSLLPHWGPDSEAPENGSK